MLSDSATLVVGRSNRPLPKIGDEGHGRDDQRGDGDGREELAPTEAGLAQIVLDGADPESDEERQHHDVEREQDIEVGRERAHPVAGVEHRHDERQRSNRCRLGRDAPAFSLAQDESERRPRPGSSHPTQARPKVPSVPRRSWANEGVDHGPRGQSEDPECSTRPRDPRQS